MMTDKKINVKMGIVYRLQCDGVILCADIEPNKVAAYEMKKLTLREEVKCMEQILADLKLCRRETPRHVMLSDLPEEEQFRKLGVKSKYFIDTIKMVAYRAETAMVNIVRQTMRHQDEARSLLRSIYATEADILPDHERKKLIVRLHQPANHCSAITITNLCRELNATNTRFPGTDLRLTYEMVS